MNFSDFLQEDLQEETKKINLSFDDMVDFTKALGNEKIQAGVDAMNGKPKIVVYSGYSGVATISSNGSIRLKSPSYNYMKEKIQGVLDSFINK